MVFINSRFIGGVLFLCAVFLTGCGTSPNRTLPPEGEEHFDAELGEDPNFTLIPNPYLQQKVEIAPETKSAFADAIVIMQSEDWAEAELRFAELTQTSPTLSGPWVNLGICRWRQKQFKTAAKAFEQAIEVNSLNVDAYNAYGVMAREQGDFAKAESLYQQAIGIWPHSPISHRNLGVLYDMYMGRFDEALQHLEMSAKVMPEPDKKLKGWIIDIKRRQAKAAREAAKRTPKEAQAPQNQAAEPQANSGETTQ